MNTCKLIIIAILTFSLTDAYSQNKDQEIKSSKAEKKIELQQQIEKLILAKQFVFIATRAFPTGWQSIDLVTHTNYVKFTPTFIDSYMPFFGQAYSVDYLTDTGLQFNGKPEVFTITRLKKNRGYDILIKVRSTRDTYDLRLDVGLEGNSNLTISCFNRSSISYNGEITPLEESDLQELLHKR